MKTIPPPTAPSEPVADPDGLTFQWERRSWSRLRLVPLLLLSLLAHAASFYVLQVAYTPTGSQLPPPAQVVLLPLDRPENAALARWLAMSDPALMSRPTTPTTRQTVATLDFHYTPSYHSAPPDFKSLEPVGTGVLPPPRPYPPGPVPSNLLPPLGGRTATVETAAPVPGQTTRVLFTGGVEAFAPALMPPVRFTAAKGTKTLDPTVFMVGVRSDGGVPFLFRQPALFQQAASGDAEAEEYARDYLMRLSFRSPSPGSESGETAVWGQATFYWGSDVYEGGRRKAEGGR